MDVLVIIMKEHPILNHYYEQALAANISTLARPVFSFPSG